MAKSIALLKSSILKRGGLEKYTLRLLEAFHNAGNKVKLLTTDCDPNELVAAPFEVVNLGRRFPVSFVQLLSFDRKCQNHLEHHPVDLVFGMERNFCPQTHYRAGNGCHAAYLKRRKEADSWLKVTTFGINPLHQLILQMEKSTFESDQLRTLFVNSNMVRREILEHYPKVKSDKIEVVHNGVEWKELERSFEEGLELREKIVKQLGLDPHAYQLLFVGNEYERKGLGLLLRAIHSIMPKNVQLTVIGKERHPELFVRQAKELGIEDRVRFVGAVKEVKVFYSAADCLVVPSLYDPFANVTVEALAMGLFVISSSSNGGSEVLSSETGLIFDELYDPEPLANCLKEALQRPKTRDGACRIREAISQLDFSNQIGKIVDLTLSHSC